MRVIAVDMDGVLTIPENVQIVNKLAHMRENLIIVYTARGPWHREQTERQLQNIGVHYHQLIMGKLKADYYVDDRSTDLENLLEICR